MISHELTAYYIRVAMDTGLSKESAKIFACAMIAEKHNIHHLIIK